MGNQGRSSGFLFGFLIGLVLGGGAVYLFGTKRGKKILRAISKGGLEELSSLGDLLEKEEEEGFREAVERRKARKKETQARPNGEARPDGKAREAPLAQAVITQPRRFFKGIKKKG